MGQLLQAGVSSRCGTNSVWGLLPETSVVISVKLNFYYLVIKAAAMAKPDGFLLTLQLLLFYSVGENWTKGSCALYKIKAIIPTFLRHGGHRGGQLLWGGTYVCFCVSVYMQTWNASHVET